MSKAVVRTEYNECGNNVIEKIVYIRPRSPQNLLVFREWLKAMRLLDESIPGLKSKFVGALGDPRQDREVDTWARSVQHPEFDHRTRQ